MELESIYDNIRVRGKVSNVYYKYIESIYIGPIGPTGIGPIQYSEYIQEIGNLGTTRKHNLYKELPIYYKSHSID